MPYREVEISLAAAGQFMIERPGNRINAISVTQLTPGGVLGLKIGNNGPMRVFDQGVARVGTDAIPSDGKQGLIVDNPVPQPGVTAILVVSYVRPADEGKGNDSAITFEQA